MVEQQLYQKLEEIKLPLKRSEWKYYHLNSVENFIYHLKSFRDERTKDRMAIKIEKYLEIVSEKVKEKSDVHKDAKELLPYIFKISDTYKYEIRFIQKPSYLVPLILLAGLFFTLKTLVSTTVVLVICAFIIVFYAIYGYLKTRARKVW